MARTEEMVVIDTKIPDPDSQFRLRPCSCRSENVGYLQIHAGSGAAGKDQSTGRPAPAGKKYSPGSTGLTRKEKYNGRNL